MSLPAVLAAGLLVMVLESTNAYSQRAKINLSGLDKLAGKASEVVNVNLEGPMLKLAAEHMAATGPKGKTQAAMLQRLKAIYVRSYEFAKPGEYSRADVESILTQLRSGGWTSVVDVHEKEETTNVCVMNEGGEAVGMAVVAAEPKELTVVNLVGPIDFSQLGGLGGLGRVLTRPTPRLERRGEPPNRAQHPAN